MLNEELSPERLKTFSPAQKHQLAAEIRAFLTKYIPRTGGHLASNLGTVELIIALHSVFSTPTDAFVFDVGHQAYTHKLITGRYQDFRGLRLRTAGGISGFPLPSESVHDAFIAGHAGISVSAALGIASAKRILGEKGFAVAIVGDGSLVCGEISEGLNNTPGDMAGLIVILNDNGMSISKSSGAIAEYLGKIRVDKRYYVAKQTINRALSGSSGGRAVADSLRGIKRRVRSAVFPDNLFEHYGFRYLGPVDGHEIKDLCEVFELAKLLGGPVLIHVKTKKGKGCDFAEENPGMYHGVDKSDGRVAPHKKHTFSEHFGREIQRIGAENPHLCVITAAMKHATGCQHFAGSFPERFFDVGICEGHAVTFAAGLASSGIIVPVIAIYSTFLQRGYDQLLHDICIPNLRVVLAVDRAGLVGEDGATHQGIYDLPWLCALPNVTVFSPSSAAELTYCLARAAARDMTGLVAVRFPRGEAISLFIESCLERSDDYCLYGNNSNTLVITYGREFAALTPLIAEGYDILQLIMLKPIPEKALAAAEKYACIRFFEESAPAVSLTFLAALNARGWRGDYAYQACESPLPTADINSQLKAAKLDINSARAILCRT